MLKVEEKLCCLSVCLQAFSLSCICLGVCTVLYRLQRQMFVREEYFALEQVEGSSFYCSSPSKQPLQLLVALFLSTETLDLSCLTY